jgi:CheY-like chemotaxis protein
MGIELTDISPTDRKRLHELVANKTLMSKVMNAFGGPAAVAPAAISARETILVAVDDPEFARLLYQLLEAEGYTPVTQMPKGFEPGAAVVDSITNVRRFQSLPVIVVNGMNVPFGNLPMTRLITLLRSPTSTADVMEAIRALCPRQI